MSDTKRKVVFCTPSLRGPTRPYIDAMEKSIPLVIEAGWDELYVQEIGNPYVSAARAIMTRKALDHKPDCIVYLDYDLSWQPDALVRLLETEGDVVAGTYRYKKDEIEYMSAWEVDDTMRPQLRDDGCFKADKVPAGFLKITVAALEKIYKAHPELVFGPYHSPSIDLFNHGAFERVWWGEDYAFSRRWRAMGEDIWLIPDLNISHWSGDKEFPGNLHEFMLSQPGGSKCLESSM